MTLPVAPRGGVGTGSRVAPPTVDDTDPLAPTAYEPEPMREWRRGSTRAAFTVAIDGVRSRVG